MMCPPAYIASPVIRITDKIAAGVHHLKISHHVAGIINNLDLVVHTA